jgi:hypothetical protein
VASESAAADEQRAAHDAALRCSPHGARSTVPPSIAHGPRINLLVEALRHPADTSAGDRPINDEAAGILLARAFGLPLGRSATDAIPIHRSNLPAPG